MLFGRQAELELIDAFVRGDHSPAPVLVFSGDAGVGKSALLDAAADLAERSGRKVIRASALEYEAELPFGALNQALLPLLDELPALEPVHREAIAVVCGLQAGSPPTQLIAGAATHALAARAARSTPLLFVIDDVPWLDLPSAMAFSYLARRIGDADIRLIVAARSELENVFVRSGFDARILRPLTDDSADALLTDRFPALAPTVRGRIRRDAAGNPLALLDLPAALDTAPRAAGEPLPLTERLMALYAGRLRDLPDEERTRLLLIVLAGAEGAAALDGRTPAPGSRIESTPAGRAGLVRANPRTGHLEFRHPLIRSAVFELSTLDERRHAHALLAEVFADDPHRRAWHLGQSASATDEGIAGLLEHVSGELLQAGHGDRATATMLRSAELSPRSEDRARRVARAAYLGSLVTGRLRESPLLLADARSGAAPSLAQVIAVAYHLLSSEGDASTAQRLLVAALEATSDPLDGDDEVVVEAMATLLLVGFYAGRAEFSEQTRQQLARIAPEPPEALALMDGAFSDAARAAPSVLRRLDAAIDELRFAANPVRITRVATAGAFLDRLQPALEPLWRVVDDGRRGGAVAKQIEALFLIANDAWFAGRWDELERVVDDGLRLSDELGYMLTAGPGRFLRGLVDATRGRTAAADSAAEQLLIWAAPRRLYALAAYASHIRCMLALSHGQFESAYRHAASISPAGTLPPFLPHALWVAFDLVEAATRSGRTDAAAAHVRALEEASVGALSPRLALLTRAAGALVDDSGWREGFAAALAVPGSERWIFDRARVQLAYGEHLRRAQSPGEARAQLAEARDAFLSLGAQPWTERATRELHAAGGATVPGAEALTPQEAAVARLAATGLTNKQIGAQLFLSPRTVSTHLAHVFPKLGIESRTALRDALDAHPADPGR